MPDNTDILNNSLAAPVRFVEFSSHTEFMIPSFRKPWSLIFPRTLLMFSGPAYHEILGCGECEHYDYSIIPPPLPPRSHQHRSDTREAPTSCQTFPRRRKNLFHHLGVGIEPAIINGENTRDIFVIQRGQEDKVKRKDLEKFLGVRKKCSTKKKDLCSFLGVQRTEIERVVRPQVRGQRDSILSADCEYGDGNLSTSTDSSSLWSSF